MKKHITLAIALALATSFVSVAAPHGMYLTKQMRDLNKTLSMLDATQSHTNRENGPGSVMYYGGAVISHAKVYAVIWGTAVDADTQKQIADYFKATVDSTYMDWLTEYNTDIKAVDGRDGTNQTIGRGSFAGQIAITPANTATDLKDSQVQAELDGQINAGVLPKPDADTLFMVFFPPGVGIAFDDGSGASCSAFCAYHEDFVSKTNGNVFYGVMPDLGGACSFGCGFAGSKFNNLTDVTSHELIEAITDPFPTPGSQPAFPQAWNTTDGQEIGDLCSGNSGQLTAGDATYVLQQEFDNKAGSCTVATYTH
jgi:hypothetical protein